MRELAYVCAQPTDKYFVWQVGMWLQSLTNIGEVNKAHVLLYNPKGRPVTDQWLRLRQQFPTAKFELYEDVENELVNLLGIYIPILRPFILEKHFRKYPELKEKAIFYCDSDVIFTRKPDIEKFLDDNKCYVSDTNSYINADYINGKVKDVLPEKLEKFKERDVLQEMCNIVGISKELPEKYNLHSGGAQYLLKNIDADFWKKVKENCLSIKIHLDTINRQYFENGDKGYQSWCADMWSVLYNIWDRGMDSVVVPEMEFAWSTDAVEKLEKVALLHNAGITGDSQIHVHVEGKLVHAPAFYKGR